MHKRRSFRLILVLVFCMLFTGAHAEKSITCHTPYEVVSHQPDFAYQVTSLSAVSDQEVDAQVTLYALDRDLPVSPFFFALYDAQRQLYYYTDAVLQSENSEPIGDQAVIPAGMGCQLMFRVSYQNSGYAALYWICMAGADRFSCTQFFYMPPQQTASYGYSTADEFFDPSLAPANSGGNTGGYYSAADDFFSSPYDAGAPVDSSWNYSYAPVDDFFSADSIDFSTSGSSYTAGTGSYVTCFPCKGTGTCSICDGKEKLHIGTVAECTCPSCHGTGDCVYCQGSGQLESVLP
jgi:hypothetical protein